MSNYNISNSLLSAYSDYRNGYGCGLMFKAIYIDKVAAFKSTEKQQAGQWFEWLCTGATLRDGSVPQPITTKTGLAAICKHLEGQKENFNAIYEGLPQYETGVEISFQLDGFNFKGILDVYSRFRFIRDIKTTGKINEAYDPHGWGENERISLKDKPLMGQAKMYTWLVWKTTEAILPFYFDVFSNTNPYDCKTIEVLVSEKALIEFEAYLIETAKMIDFEVATGFDAVPEMRRCATCPIAANCEYKTNKPEILTIKF